ncbi:hypothetical protein RRG08_025111 [Elysia crispata]|uniref:Uncharacterized protein n=1 Tax=Elysia crispata TaxID=231223 RepID=A0AAE1DZ57_9GAST|nr:hypothetical protein RRG08_025111 [Elysia crispata]
MNVAMCAVSEQFISSESEHPGCYIIITPCKLLSNNFKVSREQLRRAKQKVRSCRGLPFSKEYQFLSQNSERFLQIKPSTTRRINAKENNGSNKYTLLSMTSYSCPDERLIMRIKGVERKNSLCFTTRGMLVQKVSLRQMDNRPRSSVKVASRASILPASKYFDGKSKTA